ncbi:MAG: hypothetical protein DRO06_05100 [Thermoproteota archaeon]|nr:MAG: hypothetical protein DRO06_05100 [Candidatus Korarchaeota archaeon]
MDGELKARLSRLFGRYRGRVRAAFLFGSRVEGRSGPLSDYDFAILPAPGLERGEARLDLISDLVCDLAAELGVREDLVDVVFLTDELPEELIYRAVLRGIVLYAESPEVLTSLRERALRYLDFKAHAEKLRLRERALAALGVGGRED